MKSKKPKKKIDDLYTLQVKVNRLLVERVNMRRRIKHLKWGEFIEGLFKKYLDSSKNYEA